MEMIGNLQQAPLTLPPG